MELQILVSRKGTKVVTASNLHQVLELPPHEYNRNVKRWLSDIYGFSDGIHAPIEMQDFAARKLEHSPQKDYYLSIELAKLITLHSGSPVKAKYAKQLTEKDEKASDAKMLTVEQVRAVLELTKVMGFLSCQKFVEQQHLKRYEQQQGYTAHWWKYRAQLLGYSVQELRTKMLEIGKNYRGRNYVQMLMQIDKYEIIRMAVIDLFIALGKSEAYATNVGNLAKFFARELKVEIWDDRNTPLPFKAYNVNLELMNEVKGMNKGTYLGLWS